MLQGCGLALQGAMVRTTAAVVCAIAIVHARTSLEPVRTQRDPAMLTSRSNSALPPSDTGPYRALTGAS